MIPIFLVVVGVVALAAGWLLVRGLGPGARIGRILAATPVVPVARASALAAAGTTRYVAVEGRLDAEEPWEDVNHQPLVYMRTRLERQEGSRWSAFEDELRVVPFDVTEGLDRIAVDGSSLDEGLVVVTRESVGTAADVPDRVPGGTPPDASIRLRVEVLTAVDHARVIGVPVLDPAIGPVMRPGLRRPLILTTLEPAEAMRLLAHGRQRTTQAAVLLLGAGGVAVVLGLAWAVIDAIA